MKKYLLVLILCFNIFNSQEIIGQFLYSVEYSVTINTPTKYTDADGSVNQYFGNNNLFSDSRLNVGTYEDDYVLNSETEITNYRSTSIREPVESEPLGCTFSSGDFPFDNMTDSSLSVSWDCVPNASGTFNVQRIQSMEDLNPGANQANLCDPLYLNVAIASMSYQLEYQIENTGSFQVFPGYEYANHRGMVGLDLSQISNIENASVIIFRVKYTNDNSNISDTITFNLNKCDLELDGSANNPTPIDPDCSGENTGGFEVRYERELDANETLIINIDYIPGGTGEYVPYDPSSTGILTTSDIPGGIYTFLGLTEGDYQIAWALGDVDGGVFEPNDPVTFTISDPPALNFTYNATNPSCQGSADGAIGITPSGGSGTYSYQWTGPGGFTANSKDISGRGAGTYILTLSDANADNCSLEPVEITLTEPTSRPEITLTNITQPQDSGNGLGRISIIVSGGSGGYTYDWKRNGIAFTPTNNQNLVDLVPGTYTLTVMDGNNCSSGEQVYVLNPIPALEVNFNIGTNIFCEGDIGTIEAVASGGTGNFGYEWSTNATTQTITAGAGTYGITVTDQATGETVSASYVFDYANDLLTVGAKTTNVLCHGGETGSIVLNITGGDGGPYTVDWTDVPTNALTRSGLAAGNYTYIVSDGICSVENTIAIIEPDSTLSVEVSATNITTTGGSNGAITTGVTGGTPAYNFEWEGPNGFTSNAENIENRTAGNYQLTVTDANGCTEELEIQLTEPAPLQINGFITQNIDCFGNTNGQITVDVSGTPDFVFNWSGPNGNEPNGQTISNLEAGTYTLELTDASDNPAITGTVIITEPDGLAISAVPQNATCYLGDDGQIVVSPSGGTPPYRYSLDNGNTFQDTATFSNLSAGTYAITVQDANLCSAEVMVDVGQGDELMITLVEALDATTTGGDQGAIDIAVADETQEYEFNWSGPDGFESQDEDLQGLFAGIYTLVITNAPGCTSAPFEVTLYEPLPLTIVSLEASNVLCKGGNTGSITAIVEGTPDFDFIWERLGDPTFTAPNSITINSLLAGEYRLRLTDASENSEVTATVTVGEPNDELTATILPTATSCYNGADGYLEVLPLGGTPPYRYSMDDGNNFQNIEYFFDLQPGNYSIVVEDANACLFSISTTIDEPDPLSIETELIQNITYSGANDGRISVSAEGGTPPYEYNWTGPNATTFSGQAIENLTPGEYSVTVTDANSINGDLGCTANRIFLITEPGELVVAVEETVSLECNGDDFGELTATVEGGVPPYTYQWFVLISVNEIDLNTNSPIITNLSAGEYLLRATDFNGIIRESNTIVLEEPELLSIQLQSVTDVPCFGEATGEIGISISGGNPPYDILWSNGATAETITNLLPASYTITVLDINGCYTEMTIDVENSFSQLAIADFQVIDASAFGAEDGAISVTIEGGLSPYTTTWVRLEDSMEFSNSTEISNLKAGEYQLEIVDENGCPFSQVFKVKQPDIVTATLVNPTCFGSADGSISVEVNEGITGLSYIWNTSETTSAISNLTAGTYTVIITGLEGGEIVRDYILEDPMPLTVDLGEDQVLCLEQTAVLNALVEDDSAQYQWSSDTGFTSTDAEVEIFEAGIYTVEIYNQQGCTATDTVRITTSTDEIDANFAISSQVFVGEPVIAIDISYPIPDSVTWLYPEEALVAKEDVDELELSFEQPGEYEIGILTSMGNCIAVQYKKVLVLEPDSTVSQIDDATSQERLQDFIIYPNPTDGIFTTDIILSSRANINIRIFSFATNMLITEKSDRGKATYSLELDITGNPSGVYAVLLETPYGNSLQKVILR